MIYATRPVYDIGYDRGLARDYEYRPVGTVFRLVARDPAQEFCASPRPPFTRSKREQLVRDAAYGVQPWDACPPVPKYMARSTMMGCEPTSLVEKAWSRPTSSGSCATMV